MPGSDKVLKRREQRANREAGIGDAQGRLVRQKEANRMEACFICKTTIRMTAKNVEARQHAESRHTDKTFEYCFPVEAKLVEDSKAQEEADRLSQQNTPKPASSPKKKTKAEKEAEAVAERLANAGGRESKAKKKKKKQKKKGKNLN